MTLDPFQMEYPVRGDEATPDAMGGRGVGGGDMSRVLEKPAFGALNCSPQGTSTMAWLNVVGQPTNHLIGKSPRTTGYEYDRHATGEARNSVLKPRLHRVEGVGCKQDAEEANLGEADREELRSRPLLIECERAVDFDPSRLGAAPLPGGKMRTRTREGCCGENPANSSV